MATQYQNQQAVARLAAGTHATPCSTQILMPEHEHNTCLAIMIKDADSHMGNVHVHALEPNSGAEDTAMWFIQVKTAFDAHYTAATKQGKWMICDLRGAAMMHWFLEYQKYPAEPEIITSILKAMFRTCAYDPGCTGSFTPCLCNRSVMPSSQAVL